jgi:hypothetical protein
MTTAGDDIARPAPDTGIGGALMLKWGPTVPGREDLALEVFGQGLTYLDAMIAAGRISRHQEFLAMDGDLGANGGFMLVSATIDQLRSLQATESFNRLILGASGVVEGLVLGLYGGGDPDSFQQVLATHLTVQEELGLLGSPQGGSAPTVRLMVDE